MRLTRRIPVAVRAPALAALLMVAVGVVASERVLSHLAESQRRELRGLAGAVLSDLSLATLPAILRDDVWETFDTLDRMTAGASRLGVLRATVLDAEGRVLASSDPLADPTGAAPSPSRAAAVEIEALDLPVEGREVVATLQVTHQGAHVGDIYAVLDVGPMLADRAATVRSLAVGNALAVFALAALGWLAMRRMLRPVGVLTERLAAARDGALTPIPEAETRRAGREFATLFAGYNGLVAAESERRARAARRAEDRRLISLGRLSAAMAHEINNPLGGLINAVEALKRHGHRAEARMRGLALLESGLGHLRDVARAALATGRPTTGGRPLTLRDVDDLRLLVEAEARRRSVSLAWRQGADDATLAHVEATAARQALLNLLLNAIAAAGPGGAVSLETSAGEDGAARVTVRDSGSGLPADAARMLERGEPAPQARGLGLWVVREIAQSAGATIAVDGSSVTVEFPRPVASEAA